MYSRSYYQESPDRINLPENYDGNAFSAPESEIDKDEDTVTASTTYDESDGESIPASLGKLPFFSGLFGKDGIIGTNLRLPKLGTEEILIIATAAFLFFSKNGDKESAIILLFLLLIN